jgi:hypothetical protein
MSKVQSGIGSGSDAKSTEAQLRAEFWSLPRDAYVERRMGAAALYESVSTWEVRAIHGGGPKYRRIGRKALSTKGDILEWAEKTGRLVENTAQLAEAA